MHWNLFFLAILRCEKTEGERVNMFTHLPLPHVLMLTAAMYDFCGIWYFKWNDFLIFHSHIIINFTIENSVHVKPWLLLISNGWGSWGKRRRAVSRKKKISLQALTILSGLSQGSFQSAWILTDHKFSLWCSEKICRMARANVMKMGLCI